MTEAEILAALGRSDAASQPRQARTEKTSDDPKPMGHRRQPGQLEGVVPHLGLSLLDESGMEDEIAAWSGE